MLLRLAPLKPPRDGEKPTGQHRKAPSNVLVEQQDLFHRLLHRRLRHKTPDTRFPRQGFQTRGAPHCHKILQGISHTPSPTNSNFGSERRLISLAITFPAKGPVPSAPAKNLRNTSITHRVCPSALPGQLGTIPRQSTPSMYDNRYSCQNLICYQCNVRVTPPSLDGTSCTNLSAPANKIPERRPDRCCCPVSSPPPVTLPSNNAYPRRKK